MLGNVIFRRSFHISNYLRVFKFKIVENNVCKLPSTVCVKQQTKAFSNIFDQNTNVLKDVIIFKYENPKFFKYLNTFAIFQFFFWSYLTHFTFTTLKDAPVEHSKDEEEPWWRKINLGENKYRNTISIMCFLIGN